MGRDWAFEMTKVLFRVERPNVHEVLGLVASAKIFLAKEGGIAVAVLGF